MSICKLHAHECGCITFHSPIPYFMIQEFTFYGRADAIHGSKQKVKSYVIVAAGADGFQKGTQSVDLKVPATTTTELTTSKIIHIKYWVKVCTDDHLKCV